VSAAGAVDDRTVNGSRVMVNGANKDMTPRRVTSSSSLSGSAAAAINYPDSQQVFVGNLPQHLTDQDLIEFFERELSPVVPGVWSSWYAIRVLVTVECKGYHLKRLQKKVKMALIQNSLCEVKATP